jgi:hypothetical protein
MKILTENLAENEAADSHAPVTIAPTLPPARRPPCNTRGFGGTAGASGQAGAVDIAPGLAALVGRPHPEAMAAVVTAAGGSAASGSSPSYSRRAGGSRARPRCRSYDSELVASHIRNRPTALAQEGPETKQPIVAAALTATGVAVARKDGHLGECGGHPSPLPSPNPSQLFSRRAKLMREPGPKDTPPTRPVGARRSREDGLARARRAWRAVRARLECAELPSESGIRYFGTAGAEVQYVKAYFELQTDLTRAIEDHALVPAPQVVAHSPVHPEARATATPQEQ